MFCLAFSMKGIYGVGSGCSPDLVGNPHRYDEDGKKGSTTENAGVEIDVIGKVGQLGCGQIIGQK